MKEEYVKTLRSSYLLRRYVDVDLLNSPNFTAAESGFFEFTSRIVATIR